VSTALFVYPESMFTASALPKFVEVIKTAVTQWQWLSACLSSSDYYYCTQHCHPVDG